MFKKISIATVRSARPLVATFTEDLKPKARIDIPQTCAEAVPLRHQDAGIQGRDRRGGLR